MKRRREAQRRSRAMAVIWVGIALVAASLLLIFRGKGIPVPVISDAELTRGEQLYAENCAACHGENGNGHVVPEAPALNGNEHAWHHADGQLQRTILDGGQIMPSFRATLSSQDAAVIVRYIQNWWAPAQLQSQQAITGQDPLQ